MDDQTARDFSKPPPVKPLIVFLNDKEAENFMLLKNKNEAWKAIKSKPMILKNFGKKDKDDFSYVIFAIMDPNVAELSNESVAQFYSYYNTAPVSVFVTPEGIDEKIASFVKDHNKVYKFKPGKETKAVLDAHSYCRSIHDAKYKDDVTKAFQHFDTDGSGEIDKEELGELAAKMGTELSEE